MAGKTARRQSRMALGFPGKFTSSDLPRTPATWRERMAVGTNFSDRARICSPNPSSSLSQTASVASGVTSRRAGPVPPVVTTRQHPSRSHSSLKVDSINGRSSGIRRGTASQGHDRISVKHCRIAGPPRSWYSPRLARSDTVTMPMRTGWMLLISPPCPVKATPQAAPLAALHSALLLARAEVLELDVLERHFHDIAGVRLPGDDAIVGHLVEVLIDRHQAVEVDRAVLADHLD